MTIMALLYSLLFFLTPLILNTANSEAFELPKMYFVYSLTIVIICAHLWNYLRGKSVLFRHTSLDIPLALFLFSQIISTVFSVDVHTSLFGYYSRLNGGLLSLISYCLLYWILVIYINDNFKQKLITYSLISGVVVAIYGILEHFGIDRHYWQQDVMARVFSTLGQPNWLAAYLCILLPFSLDRFLSSKSPIHNTYYLILNTLFFICLLFTKSKSGIIAAIISLGVYGLIYLYKNKFKPSFSFVFCVLSFVFLSLLIPNPIKDRLLPTNSNSKLPITDYSLLITPSEDIRKIVWQGAIDLWRQFPLFGTGPETFADTYYWTRPAAHNLTSEWNFLYNKAHNEYLNYLATTGTFGFLTYLFFILFTVYSLLITNYTQKFSIFASFLSILITNSVGFSIVVVSLYFFLLPAFAIPELPPTKPTSKSKFFFVLLAFGFGLLESKTLFYYLADLCYSRSSYYDRRGQYPAALDQIRLSLGYRNNEPVYLLQYADLSAKLALSTKNEEYVDPALSAMAAATKLAPFSINAWKQKAQIYYYLSGLDSQYYLSALDALTKATKLAPTDAASFYMLGEFYDRVNLTDQAIVNYQQAITLKPNYDHAYFALGKIYFNHKKYTEAKPLFEKVLQIAPSNLDAKDYLAKIATISSRPR